MKGEFMKTPLSSTLFLLCLLSSSTTFSEGNCYNLGYKFAMCATKSLHRVACVPENDIVIPKECRNRDDTNRGIKDGTKAAYVALGIKKDTKTRIDILSSSLPALRKLLKGKTPTGVKKLFGPPDRKQNVMGYESWIYGDSHTDDDRTVIFADGRVMTVTYY